MRRWLPIAGLALGVWAVLPPYIGPALNTASRVEVVDHVLPGIAITLASLAAASFGLRRGLVFFATGCVVTLAGTWMVLTHIPLIAQVNRHQAPTGAAAFHTAPGLVILIVGIVWSALGWTELARDEATTARSAA